MTADATVDETFSARPGPDPGTAPAPAPGPEVHLDVRLARPQELAAAGAVVRRAYEADGHHGDYLDVVADARDRSVDADVAVAVDVDGQVLGCVTFVLPGSRWAELSGPGDAELRMLGVDPSVQGRGIGRALTRWCIDRARAADVRRLLLGSLPTMTAAHRLYQGIGFGRRPELDFSPVPGVRLLGFALDLAGDVTDVGALPGDTPPKTWQPASPPSHR